MNPIRENLFGKLAVGWLTMFAVGTDLFVVSPLLPLIAAEYRISDAASGLGVAVFALTYMISAPLLARLADRIGRRWMVTHCLCAFAAANLLTAGAPNFAWLLVARVAAGAAAAGVAPSLYALTSSMVPLDRQATCLAVIASGLLVSVLLGAPMGGLAAATFGWPSIFAAVASFSLLLGEANRRVWPEDRVTGNIAALPTAPTPLFVLAPRLAPMVAWSTSLYGVYTYLGLGLAACGFSTAQIAKTIVAYGCGAIGGILIGGCVTDRFGAHLTRGVSLVGLSLCLLLLRLVLDGRILFDLALALVSMVAQLFFAAQQSGLACDFPTRRASVLAWNNSALFVGISLGSLVGGHAISLGGLPMDLTISAIIALLGWGVNWVVSSSPTWLRPRPTGSFQIRQKP